MSGIRDLLAKIAHTPLADGGKAFSTISGKLIGIFGLAIDALIEKADEGVKARIPTLCDPSALPYIGADRVMPQGPNESNDAYRIRLQRAWDTWARAGSARSVLSNTRPMLAPLNPRERTVSDNTEWYTYETQADTTQPPDHAIGDPISGVGIWNWDGQPATYDPHPTGQRMWWRWWLLLFSDVANPWASKGPVFGAPGVKIGDPTLSIGFSNPSGLFKSIRQIVALWKAQHSWCRWIVVSFDQTLFDPTQTADGVHNPAGTFGPWYTISGNNYGPSRFANARYCDGAL